MSKPLWKAGTRLRCIDAGHGLPLRIHAEYEFVEYVEDSTYWIVLKELRSIWPVNRFVAIGCPCAIKGCVARHV